MRATLLILAVAVGVCGCAKPVLDLPEPDATQRASAKATLNTTALAQPRRPFTFEGIRDGYIKADARVVIALNRVCRRLKPAMKSLRCDAAIKKMPRVYRSHHVNAFADQDDNIGVSSVLLVKVRVEAELAAVLAHEHAHVVLGHVKKKISNAMAGRAIAGGLAGLYGAMTKTDARRYSDSWMRAGTLAGARAYSPEMEIEADRLAGYILDEAGYPPEAMRDVIVRMHRIAPARKRRVSSPSRAGFLDTHPSDDRRIAHILSAIRDVRAGVPLEANARE